MRCYYEVLGVSQKATDEELKKSYRKMALQWHPDKNPDNLEEAKLQFQLIQSAYDTLSDPQERAFYDRNRESILRGKASGDDRKPETMDLFAYFSTSCYSGFNDSEKGFYTVYRRIFERIATKDMEYMDDEEEFTIPNFGRSDTDLEDVSQFYGYWMSYCTKMSFAWADQYDVREAKSMGRWVEKKIEAENKKCRVKAKKEFNEEVRTLVAYAQKRDKRWKERKRQLEAKVAENRKKQEIEQKRQREERLKLLEESQEKEKAKMSAYEEQLREMEARFADEWGVSDSESDYNEEEEFLETLEEDDEGDEEGEELDDEDAEEEELLYDDLFCVACNKSFKTDKAMESHERSKKHRECVSRLKAKMTAENELFVDAEDLEKPQLKQDETDGSPDNSSKKKKQVAKDNTKETDDDDDDSEKENEAESEKENEPEKDDGLFRLYCAPCNKSFKTENAMEAHERSKKHRDIVSRLKAAETKENQKNDTDQAKSRTSKKKKKKNVKKNEDSDDEKSQNEVNIDNSINEEESNGEEDDVQPKLKGKKAKDARKKARETSSSQIANGTEEKPSTCSVCNQEFPSRTKMFSHIKTTGHAALKSDPSVAASGKKGKKGKK